MNRPLLQTLSVALPACWEDGGRRSEPSQRVCHRRPLPLLYYASPAYSASLLILIPPQYACFSHSAAAALLCHVNESLSPERVAAFPSPSATRASFAFARPLLCCPTRRMKGISDMHVSWPSHLRRSVSSSRRSVPSYNGNKSGNSKTSARTVLCVRSAVRHL